MRANISIYQDLIYKFREKKYRHEKWIYHLFNHLILISTIVNLFVKVRENIDKSTLMQILSTLKSRSSAGSRDRLKLNLNPTSICTRESLEASQFGINSMIYFIDFLFFASLTLHTYVYNRLRKEKKDSNSGYARDFLEWKRVREREISIHASEREKCHAAVKNKLSLSPTSGVIKHRSNDNKSHVSWLEINLNKLNDLEYVMMWKDPSHDPPREGACVHECSWVCLTNNFASSDSTLFFCDYLWCQSVSNAAINFQNMTQDSRASLMNLIWNKHYFPAWM